MACVKSGPKMNMTQSQAGKGGYIRLYLAVILEIALSSLDFLRAALLVWRTLRRTARSMAFWAAG